jgi:hypothetical protein
MRKGFAALLVAVALVSASVPSHAQPSEKKRAETLFIEARKAMDASRFAEACPKLEESWRLDPATGTSFNLALCYEKLGRLHTAVTWYERGRDAAQTAKQQKRVDFANAEIGKLVPRVPRILVTAANAPAGLAVTQNGAPIRPGTPLELDAGAYVIEATAPDHQPFRKEVTAVDGQTVTVEVTLAPTIVEKPDPVPIPTDDNGRKTRLIVGWSVAGAGVVLTGVGLVLGLSAKSAWDDARALCPEGSTSCSDEAHELSDKAHSRALVSTIVTAAGIVGIGTGIVLVLTAPKRRERETATRFVPMIGADGVGIAITGGF